MTKEFEDVYKAINDMSKKMNEMTQRLDNYFSDRHEENVNAIVETDTGLMELAELVAQILEEKKGE